MTMPRLASLLLLSSALAAPLTVPAAAWAQDGDQPETDVDTPVPADEIAEDAYSDDQAPDVSIPGGGIVVTGRRDRNVQRTSPQVVSVLSTEEIARTGEGDIAGSLSRVTGLSVVGNGYVFVRGLGDRYSLALLNGSPLPSPEPLKRVVPLDLFPTSVVASALVQKSYSVNFPGEFGGGVINLTTKAIPSESFLTVGAGASWDSETTNELGYTYYGSKTDWSGYDNGNRDMSVELAQYVDSGTVLDPGSIEAAQIGSTLITPRNAVVQRDYHLPANWSGDITGGTSFDVGDALLGVIATAGISNKYQTRDTIQQRTSGLDATQLDRDFRQVYTNQRIVVNGLVGVGLEIGDHKLRWTNVYIHDTLKRAALRVGQQEGNTDISYMYQDTAWYERQLMNTQLVGEFRLDPDTQLDLRASYANSKREAPYEISMLYSRVGTGTYGDYYVNYLDGGQRGDAQVTFSNLDEDVWSAGADLSHGFGPGWTATVGYAYQLNRRTTSRRNFQIRAQGTEGTGTTQTVPAFGLLRPDVLFQPGTFFLGTTPETDVDYRLLVSETDTAGAITEAQLNTHAYYAKLAGTLTDALTFDIGVRWEYAQQDVADIPVAAGAPAVPDTNLKNEYFLPALTLTYELDTGMQLRLNASKTIARPQFRELIYQLFFDPDGNRIYRGNPYLKDSQMYNAEGRFEWYPARDEKVSFGAFYKRLEDPIESFLTSGNVFVTSFANAPQADLYGLEAEAQKYFGLFGDRRLLLAANYTWTRSDIKVGPDDRVQLVGDPSGFAGNYFRDGSPLTGQSEHIANAQIGLEQEGGLSQQTLLLNYASKRVISRGARSGTDLQPDIVELPGFTLDFVARQGIAIGGTDLEVKFEARNLTGRRHEEYQEFETGRIEVNSYDVGRVFSLSASLTL